MRRSTELAIKSNDAAVGRVALGEGWNDIEIALGESIGATLGFSAPTKSKLSFAAIALGRGEITADLDAPLPSGLGLADGESLSYYITSRDGRITGEASPGSCSLRGRIVSSDHRAPFGPFGPLPLTFATGGEAVRVDIAVHGCEQAEVSRLQLRAADKPRPASPTAGGRAPKNVVLWIMDTLRADRVRPFNPLARAEVPNFERLAKRGVTFRRAWVEGNESKASHASMWTSMLPAVHNIRSAGRPGLWQLGRRFETIGEKLSASGRRTIGLTANGMVTRKAGYARGFEQFENPMRDGTGKRRNGWIPAERLFTRAIELLAPVHTQPFFFFLGTIDTHKPWVGHQPWLERYDPGYRGEFEEAAYPGQLGMKRGSMRCTDVPKPRDLRRINAIYDSAISYQDQVLGRFLDWLDKRGILEDTLVIITADHGEELWEDGRCGHGASLREVLVNVPLLFSYPKALPSGVVIDEGVDGIDLLPTVLELLEIERPASFQGSSLVGLARSGGSGYPRASYASQYEYAHAMRVGEWKLRVGKGRELYNLGDDPGEERNVVGNAPFAEQQLSDALSLFLRNRKRWKKSSWGVANNVSEHGAGELERR